MGKRVVDLTAEELDRLAAEAWFEASSAALRAGVPVVGREGSKIVRTYPDGRQEVLGDATPLMKVDDAQTEKLEPTRPKQAGRTRSKSKQARRTG